MRGAQVFRNYRFVRDRVLEMQAVASGGRPSVYWQEELSGFEYMLDASPLIIDKLRHHTYHVTGLRVYDYRTRRDRARDRMVKKLEALVVAGKPELLVPESPLLGGFGFKVDDHLYNLDTLKFFEVLIALDRGAILSEFQGGERRLVWEIGAGWGGFPYQFKTLYPNTTYVITDLPELFLFSATYLMALFPDARVGFWDEESSAGLSANWREYDFIFIPNTAVSDFTPDRLDLAINMVSFQEMTDVQVAGYVERAHALNCPFFYSLNRDRSAYNPEISNVSDILSRYYWPRDLQILPVSYQKMLDEPPSPHDYKHNIGWRRVKT